MRPKIYVDMDGVLADLDFFMWRMYNATHDNQKHFMETLPTFVDEHGFHVLREMAMSRVIEEFYFKWRDEVDFEILTSRGNFHPDPQKVIDQKKEWLRLKFPNSFALIPFNASAGGQDKARWAAPNCVLLDDTSRNVVAFVNAGGHGVKYIDPAVRTALSHLEDWFLPQLPTP